MSISDNIKIAQSGRYRCGSDWVWNKTGSPAQDFDLLVIMDGRGWLQNNDVTYELSAGDVFLLRGWEDYVGNTDKTHPLRVVFAHFEYCDTRGKIVRPEESKLPPLYRKMNDFSFFLKMLDRVVDYYQDSAIIESERWLSAALGELDYQERMERIDNSHEDKVAKYINRVAREIRENPGFAYHLPDLASAISYSSDHFSKLFKARINVTFRDHLIDSRMEMAKLHLRSSSAKVSKIAEMLGYSDIYLFSKQFKKKTGITPTRYRKGRTAYSVVTLPSA